MKTRCERLFEAKEHFFSEPAYRYYDQARKSSGWEREVNWNNIGGMPLEKSDGAWQLASQSSYAEQVGMIIAARLLCNADDYSVRLYLASAVQDEARHIEVFSRYALRMRGYVAPAREQDIVRINEQISAVEGFLPQFLVHTTLESFASDSFVIFAEYYAEDVLGQLYRLVQKDEARHVAAGLAYLRAKARQSSEHRREIESHLGVARDIGELGKHGYAGLAALSKRQDAEGIRQEILSRYDRRIQGIFE